MLRLIFILNLLIASTLCGRAQQRQDYSPPNYELIESDTKDKNSTGYYPALLKRYKNDDTTLNARQMHLLYYGKFFHDALFEPSKSFDWLDSIKAVYKKETLDDDDRKKLVNYYQHLHNYLPFDLGYLYRLSGLYEKLNDPRAAAYHHILLDLIKTISATGDGKTLQSGFHIGSVSDEYSLISFMGLDFGGSQSLIENCDYLTVKENKYDMKGVYFNIEQILREERKAFGLDADMEKKVMELMKKAGKPEKK